MSAFASAGRRTLSGGFYSFLRRLFKVLSLGSVDSGDNAFGFL